MIIFNVNATLPLPDSPPIPKDNPLTKEKIELGKMLFFDPRLSADGTISCQSCHNVMLGGEDNKRFSVGVGGATGTRSAPTVFNAAFLSTQFWDGRAKSLEEQAKGPITNPVEMAMPSEKAAVNRIKAIPGYVKKFEQVFGKNKINIDTITKAIATYERTLITYDSPFDKYMKGDKNAMTKSQIQGYEVFQKTGCMVCHHGVNFAGPQLPDGTPFLQKLPFYPENQKLLKKYGLDEDQGKYESTKNKAHKGLFRVPTLRNIVNTAPYFHNGSVNNLNEAVKLIAKLQLNKDLTKNEIKSIVTFLHALTGKVPKQILPILPVTSKKSLNDIWKDDE